MKKTTAFFAIISMIMLLSGFLFADAGGSDNAKSAGAAYLWLDGTQAPSACVAECTGFGIHVVEKENGDTKYLSDACKSVCLDSTASAQAGTEGTAANDNANGTVVVGGDKDIHGCIGSAGYTWCGAENKCIRSWEEACPESSCPQLMPPSQQLQDNCTAQGKALGKVTKDGCAVGYECSGIENETETGSPDNTSEGSAREGNESNIRAGNACAAPEGLYRNMLEYTNMLANAENGNDSAAYAQISEKIGNTQKAMAEAMKQCGDVNAETNVSAGMEASPAGEAA
ncbi:MAG TPA: hypothetical protein PLO51_02725, partial [Candidatus Micrarchaeota archaeon]|nr:hypothetical protein [Candidatus Micrarchaeota archaeon]